MLFNQFPSLKRTSIVLLLLTVYSQCSFGGLVPVLVTTDSATLPDAGEGYEFINPIGSISLTITDGYAIGSSFIPLLGIDQSVDALLPSIGLSDSLLFSGNASVSAGIGGNAPLGAIALQGAGSLVSFQGDVNAILLNFETNAAANATDNVIFNTAVDNLSGVPSTGVVSFEGSGEITGNIGESQGINSVNVNVNANVGESVQLSGATINLAQVQINNDGSGDPLNGSALVLNNALMEYTGNITTNLNNQNTLDIQNAISIVGEIGQAGAALNLVLVAQNSDTTVDGNIFATTTEFQANNILEMTDDKMLTGSVDTVIAGIGHLSFMGGGTITGNVGLVNPLALVTANSGGGVNRVVEFQGGTVNVANINIIGSVADPTTLLFNGAGTTAISADITTNNNDIDIIDFSSGSATTYVGNIGTITNPFNVVRVGENDSVMINGDAFVSTIEFQGDQTLNLTDGHTITGGVDSIGAGIGIFSFEQGGQITGSIGLTNPISILNLNALSGVNKVIELNGGALNSNAIHVASDGSTATTLLLNSTGPMVVNGDLTTNNSDLDFINIVSTGLTTIDGEIGNLGNAFGLIHVGQFSDVRMNENVFANLIQFQGSNTLSLGDGVVVTGAIDSSSPSTGILAFLGNGTVTGDIGDDSLDSVNLLGMGSVVNFGGDIIASALNFEVDATAMIADNHVVNAPVTTMFNNQGILVFNGSTTINYPVGELGLGLNLLTFDAQPGDVVTLNNNVYATTVTANSGGVLYVPNSQTITGDVVVNSSTLAITTETSPLAVNGTFTLGADTRFQLDMNHSVASGVVSAEGVATVDPSAEVFIINSPVNIPGGEAVIPIIIDGSGNGDNLSLIPVVSDSQFVNFTTQIDNNILQLVLMSHTSGSFLSLSCPGVGIPYAFEILFTESVSGALESIMNELDSFLGENAFCQAFSSLSVIVDGGVLFESFEAQRTFLDVLFDRNFRHRFCKHYPEHRFCQRDQSGMAFGDFNENSGVWIKAIGAHADQRKRQGINGYKNTMGGFAIGFDKNFGENDVIGVSFSVADLNIDHQVDRGKTRAKSYQEMLYGYHDFENGFFLNWGIALAYNAYQNDRNVIFGKLSFFPEAKFHGWQSGTEVEVSYDFDSHFSHFHLVPILSLYYGHLDLGAYTETHMNTANQHIDSTNFNMLLGGVGLRVLDYVELGTFMFSPEAHVRVFCDFVADPMALTSQFIGGGPAFETVGFVPARNLFNVGGSLQLSTVKGWTMSTNGEFNIKNDYTSYNVYIRLRYDFI